MKNTALKLPSLCNVVRTAGLVIAALLLLHTQASALDVQTTRLDSGMKLLIAERHNLPIVRVSVGIDAGSIREPEDRAGLASLVAGLLTEGTQSRTGEEISEAIEFVGGSIGAGGGEDFITVNLSVLKKDLDLGFELLADIIMNPSFPEAEITRKVERIKGALRSQEDDPGFVASRLFSEEVFGNHPYGRLVSGTPESLDRIEGSDLMDFHAAYYVPNNSVMAVVGDITGDEVSALVKKYFSQWTPSDVMYDERPVLRGKKQRKTILADKDLTQATIILGHMGVSRDNPDYYALSVMNYILGGGGFASRLMQNIREEKGLVYDIHSYFSADRYGGSFRVGLQTKNESANTAVGEILKELKRMRNEPVSDDELRDAKSFMTGSFPMRIDSSAKIVRFLVAVDYYGLGVDYIDNYPDYINAVTKEKITEAAQRYLDDEQYVLVVVGSQDAVSLEDKYQ